MDIFKKRRGVIHIPGYTILSKIGEGGMGEIFKAEDTANKRTVAVKVLSNSLCKDESSINSIMREAKSAIALDHPNIIKGITSGRVGSKVYFVMEFVKGKDLDIMLDRKGAFVEEEVLNIAIQVTDALVYAYRRGIVHRDIKPQNIILQRDGSVKLIDLGLIWWDATCDDTNEDYVIGTPSFMSPEQISGMKDIDTRSDIYSLGLTMITLLAGASPYDGMKAELILTKQVVDETPIPEEVMARIPQNFRYMLKKMTAKDRAFRYQSPDELYDDLFKVKRLYTQEKTNDPEESESVFISDNLDFGDDFDDSDFGFSSEPSKTKNLGYGGDLTLVEDFQDRPFFSQTPENSLPHSRFSLSEDHLAKIPPETSMQISYRSGEVIFYEGEENSDLFIMLSGRVEFLRSGKRIALLDQQRSFFGELAGLLSIPRSATVRAMNASKCLVIKGSQVQNFFIALPEVQLIILKTLGQRLVTTTDRLMQQEHKISTLGRYIQSFTLDITFDPDANSNAKQWLETLGDVLAEDLVD